MENLTILAVLDRATVAHFEGLDARRRVVQAGGRLSINGVPPLPANELSHVCARSWQELRQFAPSLARRHDGSDGSPPMRHRRLDYIDCLPSRAVEDSACCSLVTTEWLERWLGTGVPEDERNFALPTTIESTQTRIAAAVLPSNAKLKWQKSAGCICTRDHQGRCACDHTGHCRYCQRCDACRIADKRSENMEEEGQAANFSPLHQPSGPRPPRSSLLPKKAEQLRFEVCDVTYPENPPNKPLVLMIEEMEKYERAFNGEVRCFV